MNTKVRTATASHTPGPWTFSPFMQDAAEIAQIRKHGLEPTRKLTNEGQAIVLAADYRVALVDCQTEFKRGKGYQTDCEERSANARLIAAAPDMLAALGNLVEVEHRRLTSGAANEPTLRDIIDALDAARAAIAKATDAA